MLHKIFHWWYLRRRSSFGTNYKKIDNRSKDRDLINYFHDFGGETTNSRRSYWLYRKIFKFFIWIIVLLFAIWFSVESYQGLIIYD
jgi:hypothetical protein